MKIIERANLPKNQVSCVAISCEAFSLVNGLERLGISTIKIQPSIKILPGLSSHADIHLLHLGGRELWISKNQLDNKDKLEELGFITHVLPVELNRDYPNDVLLNTAIIGDKVFLNQKCTCKEINFTDKKIINVKQGYSKCSICIVNHNAIITDDEGIHKSAKKNQIDSLLIQKGDIKLKGMNYGFIGGCCGLIARDIMLFNGKLDSHRNCDEIKAFLANYNINTISVGEYPLADIGGILPLLEK